MLNDLLGSIRGNAGRNAFCVDDKFYSYDVLRDHVVAIRRQIEAARTTGTSKHIAVVCSNDIRTYASLLAIWFSGCAYVPLGLHNPAERNLTILGNAEAELIISTTELDEKAYAAYKIIRPATEAPRTAPADIDCPPVQYADLAYILFTSGSTGVPKGVAITHGNIAAFLRAFAAAPFSVTQDDRCLQMFELTFDVSISSYLPALLCGACVYTVPNDGIKYMHVLRVLSQHKLTSIQIVPSIIKLAKPLLKRLKLPDVKCCILTGEATMIDLVTEWRTCIPNAEIFNYYGPTEATIYCSFLPFSDTQPKHYNGMLAIGQAFDGMELLIVKENGEETAPDEKGELLIGGPQLTPGYIKNPDKNSSSFLEKAVPAGSPATAESKPMRFYRSGDLCFRDNEGDIFYCGRLDNQVKIQGFRIELSEIEFLVRSEFAMNNVVIVSEDTQGATRLLLVVENGTPQDSNRILGYLKTKLPVYMVPYDLSTIAEFPLNTSGKTDRKRIKELLNGTV